MEKKLKQEMLGWGGHQGGLIKVLVAVGLGDCKVFDTHVYIYGEISREGKMQGKAQLIDAFLGILDNHMDRKN